MTTDTDRNELIEQVYKTFVTMDEAQTKWDEIDDKMSYLEWLSDYEVAQEAQFVAVIHTVENVKCDQPGCRSGCFAPKIVQAASFILERYFKEYSLSPKERYILSYYLTLTHLKKIISEDSK